MSTSQLSGGARIHYIFQSIFVKSLEEVDPCEDLTDDDIRTAIQNATGPRSALFVPEVPFEVLVRRQISRLLDPSLQCARFIFDELMKISHCCMVTELQRFPFLRKRMDEVIGNFLREGLEPSENMIGHIIEMEMDYINTSHPNFIGGSKALELAVQQTKSSRVPLPSRPKDGMESDKGSASEKSAKTRALFSRQNGVVTDQVIRTASEAEKVATSGLSNSTSWGISSIFGGSDSRVPLKESASSKLYNEPINTHSMEQSLSMIHLREPPDVLKPSDRNSETEAVEIAVTKLLLKSYYDIVRKNIEDFVPKAIMHFLVNNTKRDLHNVFIKKLYRENLFEEMLQEPDEDLDELPLETETVERGYSLPESTGLPRIHGLPTSSLYSTSSSGDYYGASPKNPKSGRKSSHSGEFQPPSHAHSDSNGSGRAAFMSGFYPTVDD
ncbi:hypothetical protein K1719_008208 [Acacia pycnantha]|nr:hypothetical protein K1719_008208 [Acacia pycnantha]